MHQILIKKIMLCLLFFGVMHLTITDNSFGGDLTGKSNISDVTVYPGSARVTRVVELDLSFGEHSIILEDIISQLDENSLTVSGKGAANVKIFGAYIKHQHSKETADKRVQELTAKIEKLSDSIQGESNRLERLRKEIEYLDSIKLFSGNQIPKDLITSMPTSDQLGNVQTFLTAGYEKIDTQKRESDLHIRELTRDRDVVQRELNELRSHGSKQQKKLVVDLECSKPGKFKLDVSYLVRGAYWRSIYDARANYDKSEVELTSFAQIKQSTGEDWGNVNLTLSTAQPTVSGHMPYVSPWILNPHQPRRKARVNKMMMSQSGLAADVGQVAGFMEAAPSNMPSEIEEEDAELAYSQVEQKGASIVYKIVRPAIIKSDGTENKYPISTQTLKANFEYSSYPRLKPSAYLGSRVTNSKDLQLLAGQVNLFLNDDYVGKSNINTIGPGEEFNLYLGVDENVKIKREQISRKMDDVLIGGIKAPNRKTTFKYKLTVENYKDKKITVNLFEAIPVSQDDRIKVKVFDIKKKPTDTNWEDRKGVWRWDFQLNPGAKQEFIYTFSVDHPRDMNVPGI